MSARGKQVAVRCAAIGSALLLAAIDAAANPTGPQVVAGTATVQGAGTNTVRVTNSPGAIINWQSFSIGSGQTTQFVQQSQTSAVLNRVVGANASQIAGALTSNGRVFLVNPNGVLFTAGAQVSAPTFVATTANITDQNFLNGNRGWSGQGSFLQIDGALQLGGPLSLSSSGIHITSLSSEGVLTLSSAGTIEVTGALDPNSGTINLTTPGLRVDGPLGLPSAGAINLIPAGGTSTVDLVLRANGGQVSGVISARSSALTVQPTITPVVIGSGQVTLTGNTPASIARNAVSLAARVSTGGGTTITNGNNITLSSPNVNVRGGNLTTTSLASAPSVPITLQKREPVF